ncbi:glycosyltransferase family 4 protein [Pseudoalteromonas sp. 5Ae-yellow]|uniref:glycosyltransferase family 4 protein n=1 Tax=Pseudoalteromonas sp. 5Ae-yellow TaxID=2759847 RepID=UPI0015F4618B|nr:glycosyltransferase [Pseudoalteromonas sp. 5Ae-yellow]MBA6409124.1 glycosyltransferase family 4 protein [Pseudoalteromonas sp. 5Ae-yellow]
MNAKVVRVSLEHRFYFYEGSYYTQLAFPYLYWKDYLRYFDQIEVIARVKKVDFIDDSFKRVDGKNVSVLAMPYYVGVKSFILNLPRLLQRAFGLVKGGDVFILRSGNVSNVLWIFVMLFRKGYVREYPGNIYEGITGFAGKSIHIKILAQFLNFLAKKQAQMSKANSFVSQDCKATYATKKPSYVFSSFNVDEIVTKKNSYEVEGDFKLVTVGRLEGEKGHKDLLNALEKTDVNVELTVIGDGSQFKALKEQAQKIKSKVNFLGAITDRDKLFNTIANADLFVIPSHTEGMPRSLLESMAIGIPCIGTNVGGIPEVLNADYLAPPKDPQALAELIKCVSLDTQLRKRMGTENLQIIKKRYSKESMDKQKSLFWGELYK